MDFAALAGTRAGARAPRPVASQSRHGGGGGGGGGGGDDDDGDSDDDVAAAEIDPETARGLMRAFVKNALDGARRGSRAQYYELLDAIDGLEEADVARDKTMMLEALAEHVSSLDVRVHENLLQKVLRANPWRCRDDVVSLVIVFCVNLVVTHAGSLLQTVLDVLVESFTPPAGYPVEALEEDMDMGRRGGGAGAGAGAS